jgi:hypothetical protein
MRGLILAVVLVSLLTMAPTCQQSPRETGGSQVIVSDLSCRQVWDMVQRELKRLEIPVAAANPEEGWIETGPVYRDPLPGSTYARVEEQYRLELACREPLTTRISGRPQVRGIKADQSRVILEDPWPYWERFLKNLKIK